MAETKKLNLKKWAVPGGIAVIAVLGVAGFFFGKSSTHPTEAAAKAEHGEKTTVAQHGNEQARAETLDGKPIEHGTKEDLNRKPASEDNDYDAPEADEEIEVQIAHQDHKVAHTEPEAHAEKTEKGIYGMIVGFFKGLQEKVDAIKNAEETSRRLQLENAHLRVMLETSRYACLSDEAKKQTEKVGAKLNAETGTKIGRTLASIPYQIPENMMPDALYTLGVSYFKARDSEKAVAILSFLADMQGDDTYKTPSNFLMTGISWFRLDNYKYADEYFSRVVDLKPTKENRPYKVQAKIWKALVAERRNDKSAAQAWLKRTLESHPQTKEARWINPQEGDRLPASTTESTEHSPTHHESKEVKAEAHHQDEANKESHPHH